MVELAPERVESPANAFPDHARRAVEVGGDLGVVALLKNMRPDCVALIGREMLEELECVSADSQVGELIDTLEEPVGQGEGRHPEPPTNAVLYASRAVARGNQVAGDPKQPRRWKLEEPP